MFGFSKNNYIPLDKKELFIHAFKNPDQYTYLIFENYWNELKDDEKIYLLSKYRKNNYSIMGQLVSNKINNAHIIMKYLLESGFEFNRKDKSILGKCTWGVLENLLNKKKKADINKITQISLMLNKQMVEVLADSFDTLPQDLKARVESQSDSKDLLKIYEMEA